MNTQMQVTGCVSHKFYDAMTGYAGFRNWEEEIYGVGPFPRPMEVVITQQAVAALGGITEVRRGGNWPASVDADSLNLAFDEIRANIGVDARIDGFIQPINCFLEAKVSKIDTLHGTRGGRCLFDIGQWAHDIGRLAIMGKHFPHANLIYSIVAIRREIAPTSTPESWLEAFKTKMNSEMNNDLTRPDSELKENTPHRRLQRNILETFCSNQNLAFSIKTSDRWAVITIEVRPFVACLS